MTAIESERDRAITHSFVKLNVPIKMLTSMSNGRDDNPAVHHRPDDIIENISGFIDAYVRRTIGGGDLQPVFI